MREPTKAGDIRIMAELVMHAANHGVDIDATTNAERRATVLRHPDLAEKLCDRPMSYQRPDQWTGYVAPELLETGARNTSPYREQVAAIYEEALRREGGAS